jgi:hypothetical protein
MPPPRWRRRVRPDLEGIGDPVMTGTDPPVVPRSTAAEVNYHVSRGWTVSVADEMVRFVQDLKPLFRPVDYESMAWASISRRTTR